MTEKRNFSFDEDFVIKQALRENLQELRSSRLHYAGPATDVELPQKPFGLVDISQQEKNVSYSNIDSKFQMTCLRLISTTLFQIVLGLGGRTPVGEGDAQTLHEEGDGHCAEVVADDQRQQHQQ